MEPMTYQARGCEAIADGLHDSGVELVIASPGYRNAPLLYALERHPGLSVTMIIDERTAGFVALGAARSSGRPVALACTSGSAGGHYLPALMEAKNCGIPLIAVTADRPMELQRIGANQTIEQTNFYADFVLAKDAFEFSSDKDEDAKDVSRTIRARVCAVAERASRSGGPVHFNVRLRKPLAPKEGFEGPKDQKVRKFPPKVLADREASQKIASFMASCSQGVIVDGPTFGPRVPKHRERLCRLSRESGWPILADALAPTNGATEALGLRALWLSQLPVALSPQKILWFGRAPTSKVFDQWLGRTTAEVLHVHQSEHVLDNSGVSRRLFANAECVPEELELTPVNDWRQAWQEHVQQGVDWHRQQSRTPRWEAQIIQELLDRWPHRWVHVGNSTAIRDVDSYIRPPKRTRFLGNRGLSGIDGTLATAWGETIGLGEPVLVIVGDVTFAHDVGTLFQIPKSCPIAIAVLDNDGGRIFTGLPVAKLPEFRSHYLTPPSLDIKAIATAAGFAIEDALPTEIQPRTCYQFKVDPKNAHGERNLAMAAGKK